MDYVLPKEVKNILDKFQKKNFQIFIVGGAVRDLLMGIDSQRISNWDFTTDAKPEEILALFPEGFYDNKFGTVGIPVKYTSGEPKLTPEVSSQEVSSQTAENTKHLRGGVAPTAHLGGGIFEITTMRKEGRYTDFRHPSEISWTNKIGEDLARRDFTVNAIALRLATLTQGKLPDYEIVDPFNGQSDIKDKIIRAVGNPSLRFQEDALRLIRAVRFATELEFKIESKTFQAVSENARFLKEIAFERIRDELFKILASKNPYAGMIKLREVGILQIILPELEKCFGIVQEGPKHDRIYDIGEHSLLTLQHTASTDPLVRLAALLHDIGKQDTVEKEASGNVTFYNHDVVGGQIVLKIAKRFNLSKQQTDKLFRLVRWHLFTVDERQTDSAIRRFIKNVGLENIDDMMALRVGDRLGGGTQKAVSWRMEKFQERIKEVLEKPFSISDLKVNGNDVMKTLNIKPGPKVGEILQKLFEEVLEDASKNNRKDLLNRIKQLT